MKGQIISGEFGKILVRQKSDDEIELGEILVSESMGRKILLQVYDLLYGSQISQQNLELLSGMQLEEDMKLEFLDGELRNYTLAVLKNLITINNTNVKSSKSLPGFFSYIREIVKEDLSFLTMPPNPLYLGKLRTELWRNWPAMTMHSHFKPSPYSIPASLILHILYTPIMCIWPICTILLLNTAIFTPMHGSSLKNPYIKMPH